MPSSQRKMLRLRYGISVEDYGYILKKQHGTCAICDKKGYKPLVVDHDHITGQVRGLLCHGCNIRVGKYENKLRMPVDSWELVTEYLSKQVHLEIV